MGDKIDLVNLFAAELVVWRRHNHKCVALCVHGAENEDQQISFTGKENNHVEHQKKVFRILNPRLYVSATAVIFIYET